MRIIAGSFKGTKLFSPGKAAIRPTLDRVREYIFSCIAFEVQGKSVLDLFAGTGALGLEAKSRGAKEVVFVDNSTYATELVGKNISKLKTEGIVVRKHVISFLQTVNSKFDYIFADPPYTFDQFDKVLEIIAVNEIIDHDGMIIYETGSRRSVTINPDFEIIRQKKLGDTQIIFYQLKHD